MWHDACVCDMTHLLTTWAKSNCVVWHDSFTWHDVCMHDMTHLAMPSAKSKRVTSWLIHMWHDVCMRDMTHIAMPSARSDCVMCAMTQSYVIWRMYVWHDSPCHDFSKIRLCESRDVAQRANWLCDVTWLIHTCDLTLSCAGHDSMSPKTSPSARIDSVPWRDWFIRVTGLLHLQGVPKRCSARELTVWRHVAHSLCETWLNCYASHDLFLRETWLTHVCDMTNWVRRRCTARKWTVWYEEAMWHGWMSQATQMNESCYADELVMQAWMRVTSHR